MKDLAEDTSVRMGAIKADLPVSARHLWNGI